MIEKRGATMPFSWEMFAKPDPEQEAQFYRTHHRHEPDETEWAEWRQWKKDLEALQAYGREMEWYLDGYEGDEILEPRVRWVRNAD